MNSQADNISCFLQTPHLPPPLPAQTTYLTPTQTPPPLQPRLKTSQSANALSSPTYGQVQRQEEVHIIFCRSSQSHVQRRSQASTASFCCLQYKKRGKGLEGFMT